MRKLKETKEGRPSPSPIATKAQTNLQTQTKDKQQLESIKLKEALRSSKLPT
jgi:hypothetical protein